MNPKVRYFVAGVATVYVLVAVMSGMAMSRAIPALNAWGGLYVGATWPMAMFCAGFQVDCTPLPAPGSPLANAFFTFSEPHP